LILAVCCEEEFELRMRIVGELVLNVVGMGVGF
jgi:hypothetical protein